jgi:hypothetical protein
MKKEFRSQNTEFRRKPFLTGWTGFTGFISEVREQRSEVSKKRMASIFSTEY